MKETPMAMALSGLSFMMTVIWGGPLLRILRHFKIGKLIRAEGPQTHQVKMGTPTMGGVMIVLPVTLLTLLLNAASLVGLPVLGRSIILPLAVMLSYAVLGAIDDWEGIRGPRRGLGMRARTKFTLQTLVAIAIAYSLKELLIVPNLYWPTSEVPLNLGWWYLPIAAFIIVAMANAVNFTDGIDGLASMICMTMFGAYGIIAIFQGQVYLARFCFCIVGALAGFLWFNAKPAELMMGDTGSQALGAMLAVVALMTGRWVFLPLIAIIPVSELLSVIIQVSYFKLTHGKRVFKKAPIHHHFEMLGWQENQIVIRFWLIGFIGAMLGFALTFLG